MDDKDRTIVTFGGDDEPSVDVTETAGTADAADAADTFESSGISMDVDIPQDVVPETRPYEDTIVGANTNDYLEGYKAYIDRYAAENSTEDEYLKAREEAEKFEAQYGAAADYGNTSGTGSTSGEVYSARPADTDASADARTESRSSAHGRTANQVQTYSKPVKAKKEPKYVTKGFLVMCMIFTMLVSSILGALAGGALNGSNSSDDGRTERDDSELSQLSLSDATGSDMTVSEIVEKNADAVVEILVSGTSQGYFGQMEVTEGAGSGVIVREDGYIVTNYHVITGANKVQVTLHNGETYPATIVGGDNDKDIAIIKIDAKGLTVAEIGDSSKVEVGDTAVAIGNPLGQLGGTATTGIISALDRNLEIDGRTLTLMQTDAAINGGNSGGGLFNSKGELIGIVDAKSSGVGIEGLAFAIPINTVADTINDIIENGNVTTRPVVGITIAEVSEESAQYYQLDSAGVYITQVTGENAQKAGLQQNDRIVSFEGETIESSQQFITAVKKHKAGDTVTMVVNRGGQDIEIKTVLEEYTSAE